MGSLGVHGMSRWGVAGVVVMRMMWEMVLLRGKMVMRCNVFVWIHRCCSMHGVLQRRTRGNVRS